MWECKTCGEKNEDTFDLCWKCSTPSGDRRNSTSEYLEDSDSFDEDAKQFYDENLMVSVASSISSRRSITFSLRSLFALIVVAALGFFTWGFVQGVQDEKNRLATILNEIESAKTELAEIEARSAWPANPVLQQAIQDEHAAIRSLREQSEAHLPWLLDKYASIEPRGPDVVSIRSLPEISGSGETTIAYRIYAPPEREVWLKCGMKTIAYGSDSGTEPPASSQVIQRRLSDIGRYEQRLSPGEHAVSIIWGSYDGDQIRIRVTLDSSVLIDSNLPYLSSGWSRPRMEGRQYDYQEFLERPLVGINLKSPDDENPPNRFDYDVSLSSQASDLPPFPGVQ